MSRSSYHLLRVGLGITFLWVGVLIFREPDGWGSLVFPWIASLLPASLHGTMLSVATIDAAMGLLLLLDMWTWYAALLASAHLLMVLLGTGITDITVRDIGLLAAALAVLRETPVPSLSLRQIRTVHDER